MSRLHICLFLLLTAYGAVASPVKSLLASRDTAQSDNTPYDAELQYITNEGQAYIDTGFKLSATNGQGVVFAPYRTPQYLGWIIFTGARQGFMHSINFNVANPTSTPIVADYGSGGALSLGSVKYGEFIKVEVITDVSAGMAYALTNDVLRQSIAIKSGATTANAWFFFANTEWRYGKTSIARYWITDGAGKRVRDWIPVLVGEEPCFYEICTGTFFKKKGGGQFIAGPKKR